MQCYKLFQEFFVRSASTPGVNFINVYAQILRARSKKHKISVKSSVSFYTFGILGSKSCAKDVDEIDTWPNESSISLRLKESKYLLAPKSLLGKNPCSAMMTK